MVMIRTYTSVDGIHVDMNHLKKGEVKYVILAPACLLNSY